MPAIRVFLSFDHDHDVDLYERMLEDSRRAGAGFEIVGHSAMRVSPTELRRCIAGVDQLIVLCGEHTDASARVAAEVSIGQEANLPCLMLWGRRASMCTRPIGAARNGSMYTWARDVVREQLTLAARKEATREALAEVRKPPSSGSGGAPRP